MRNLLLSVRAGEACHCHVNHTFSELEADEKNLFAIGTMRYPKPDHIKLASQPSPPLFPTSPRPHIH